MSSLGRSAIVVTLSFAAACGEPGGAPRLVLAHGWDPFADSIGLAWIHPRGEVSGGFALERRVGLGPFTTVTTVVASKLSLEYAFEHDAPDLADFEFRLRALPDEDGSRVSDAVTARRGLRRPTLDCVHDAAGLCTFVNGGFQLNWSNVSPRADALLLERFVRTSSSFKSQILPAIGMTEYFDTDLVLWIDGAQFSYRLTAIGGSVQSLPSSFVDSAKAPPRSP